MMRQLPLTELKERLHARRSRSAVVGGSSAALGAGAMMAAGQAGGQQQQAPSPALPSTPQNPAEFVLMAPMNGAPVPVQVSETAQVPVLVPSTFQGTAAEALPTASELALAVGNNAATYAPLPTMLPVALPAGPASAVSLVSNVREVAQEQQAQPAPASDSGSFWPDGHWESDGGPGFLGSVLGLSTAAALGGIGWFTWRLFDTQPEFDDPLVFETFLEMPCTRRTEEIGDVVYRAEAKHGGDGSSLTYSIVEYDTDDSSLLTIDPDTGEVRFISDPSFASPGDLDRDRIYDFVVQAEDNWGNTATQSVQLTIDENGSDDFLTADTDFLQHGGSLCADEFTITAASNSPSLFDVSGGLGNDYAQIVDALSAGTDEFHIDEFNIGIDLGSGNDTFHVQVDTDTDTVFVVRNVLVDLGAAPASQAAAAGSGQPSSSSSDDDEPTGSGRDVVEIDSPVNNLVVQNFDDFDMIYFGDAGLLNDADELPALTVDAEGLVFTSEDAAISALGEGEIVAYFNGEDSFILADIDSGNPVTTIKLQDYILTSYDQIVS